MFTLYTVIYGENNSIATNFEMDLISIPTYLPLITITLFIIIYSSSFDLFT